MRRLILFDIDGTLLATDGAGRRAFERCLRAAFGRTGPIEAYDFHGKTDPQIVYDLLGHEGIPRPEVEVVLPAFWEAYGAPPLRRSWRSHGPRAACGRCRGCARCSITWAVAATSCWRS